MSYKIKRYFIYAIGACLVFMMSTRQISNVINGSFSNTYNFKADLTQSLIGKIVGNDPVRYTILCILLIVVIAFCCEKLMHKFYEIRNKDRKV